MSYNLGDIPPEFEGRPSVYIALTGLDIVYNAIHKSIWETFSSNRRLDRVPINVQCLPGDHEYLKPKQKRTNYEWYVPKGILKKSWLKKHLNQIPAVTVIFYDLDWDEPQWAEKLQELMSKTAVVRTALQGRNTRIAVVLIQKNPPLPPGEDVQATERAAAVCNSCELSNKALFVLPHSDPLIGYVIRLENALFELAQGYYHQEVRRVKNHREMLNKTNHQLLFIRHHFKMAAFNELKQDIPTALKQYKQAYLNILEVRTTDINLLEIKIMAGFVNYKICHLSFQLNTPLDAISQFRKHIDIFKNKIGPKELGFEHCAWISKQFSLFGDLFDEAIRNGLTAIQTQHPGFYYQQAAYHSIARRKLAWQLCTVVEYPTANPLVDEEQCEFFGQRPWRPNMHSLECTDLVKEKDGISATQYKEFNEVNHSLIVIPLLNSAVNQFKKFRCTRMQHFLIVQLAEEQFLAKEPAKAFSLLTHVQWNYREERWWLLLTHTLTMSLRCAYSIAALQEYVTLCVELIGPHTHLSKEEKCRIQTNMQDVLTQQEPNPEPGCTPDVSEQADKVWKQMKEKPPSMFTLEMNMLVPFVECKATFDETIFVADQEIKLGIYIRTQCPLPIRFSKLCILFSNQKYNSKCVLTDESKLSFTPGDIRRFDFKFYADLNDVSKDIAIKSVALYLGNEEHYCFLLHWSYQHYDHVSPDASWLNYATSQASSSPQKEQWNTLPAVHSCRVVPRKAQMEVAIAHNPPALLKEQYLCKITCQNQESVTACNVTVTATLVFEEGSPQQLAQITSDANAPPSELNFKTVTISLSDIPAGQNAETKFYIQATDIVSLNCDVQVKYQVTIPIKEKTTTFTCEKVDRFEVPTIAPFNVTSKIANSRFETIQNVYSNVPFVLLLNIENMSPTTIQLHGSSYELSPTTEILDEDAGSQLKDIVLNGNDQASTCVCLKVPQDNPLPQTLGNLLLSWKRSEMGDDVPLVQTIVPLPSVTCAFEPVLVTLDIAAYGYVRTPLPIAYKLQNCTTQTQDIEFLMESSDAFMFAGYKQLHCRLLPQGQQVLSFNLYPLVPGYVNLPRLRVVLTRGKVLQYELERSIEGMLPSHVFIMPREKTTSK